ncbi:hypothetical protein EKO04_002869 [Ascochyta lentis]|uniref:C2H2-type domain-containing protein n=1 Tax=Ascochyta lentis TaxID=205686 RepID=A0A8H7JA20_9PLEO|nr:hypothetical protein EKO04_002869 [Ascochyta lentis]
MSFDDYVIEEGYWRNSFDSNLYMTQHGQSFKYFHQHIHQRRSIGSKGSFHRYAELPAELQLRIMQFCDAPTLFQLMLTTHNIRIEATKLFFSDPATWYRLQADFLLQHPSAGESLYEPCFLASVKQLEIYSPHLNSRAWKPDLEGKTFQSSQERSEYVNKHIKASIQAFWCTVQRLCPQVRRIMFTKDGTSFPDKNVMIDCFQRMAQLCPQGLDVFFYTTEPAEEAVGRRRKRMLWRLRTSDEDTAMEITPKLEKHSKAPGVIVVPPQKPHRGRVGEFIKAQTIWEKYYSQSFAAEFYRAAAVEQHYFQGRHEPFGCSVANCDAWFDQPEQYTTHLLATRHGKGETPPGQAGAFVTANTKLELMLEQETQESHKAFWNWWGWTDAPSEQRTMAEMEVMHQLEHDVLYAQDKPVSEHVLLQSIYEVEMSNSL